MGSKGNWEDKPYFCEPPIPTMPTLRSYDVEEVGVDRPKTTPPVLLHIGGASPNELLNSAITTSKIGRRQAGVKALTPARHAEIRAFLLEVAIRPDRYGEIASTFWINKLIERLKQRNSGTGNVTSTDIMHWLYTTELAPLFQRIKIVAAKKAAVVGTVGSSATVTTATSTVVTSEDEEEPKKPYSQNKDDKIGNFQVPAPGRRATSLQSASNKAACKQDEDPPTKKIKLENGPNSSKRNLEPWKDATAWLQLQVWSKQLSLRLKKQHPSTLEKAFNQKETGQQGNPGKGTKTTQGVPPAVAVKVEVSPPDVTEATNGREGKHQPVKQELLKLGDLPQGFPPGMTVSMESGTIIIKMPSCSPATTFYFQPTQWFVGYHPTAAEKLSTEGPPTTNGFQQTMVNGLTGDIHPNGNANAVKEEYPLRSRRNKPSIIMMGK